MTVLQNWLEAAVGSCVFAPHSTTCICMYVYGVLADGRIEDDCDMYDIERVHVVGLD
jgi:hypothetical protein